MRSNSEIVDIIVSLYTEKNWSLSEFARRLGFPKSSLSRYFNKSREFPINKVYKFAEVLGVPSEYILGINESTDDILAIYNKLVKERKKNVYNYAERQLHEQNNVVNMSDYIQEENDWYEVKFYGSVSAGTGLYLDDEQVETIRFESDMVPKGTDFCLKVNGDSMESAFHDGDYVFIKRETEFRNGTIGAVIVNGEAYLKKLYITEDSIKLVSLNKKYQDITVTDTDNFKYVGTVVF